MQHKVSWSFRAQHGMERHVTGHGMGHGMTEHYGMSWTSTRLESICSKGHVIQHNREHDSTQDVHAQTWRPCA